MKKNEVKKDKQEKNDFKPIGLYLGITFGGAVLITIILTIIAIIKGESIDVTAKATALAVAAVYPIIFIVFICLYRKKLLKDAKKLSFKDVLIIILLAILIIVANDCLTRLFAYLKVEMSNQNLIVSSLESFPILSSLSTGVLVPVIEELVFRYAFGTYIKDNKKFLIVSSLVFALFHGFGVITIIYALIGLALGLVYIKYKRNIMAPILVHILNNSFSILEVFLGI